MSNLVKGDELEKRALELGVDISGEPRTQSSSGQAPRAPDFELQRRIIEAERRNRETKLWIVALISGIASVISALTALFAVLWKR